MTTIDIRDDVGFIDTIKFADDNYYRGCQIRLNEDGDVHIEAHGIDISVYTHALHIPNLILALQKAVQLGWCK